MPRHKKTASPAAPVDPADLPELTKNQFAFVKAWLFDGKTKSDAYRAAYPDQRMDNGDIWREASLLSRNPKVVQWVRALRLAAMDECRDTLETWVAEARRLKEIAIATGNVGAAVLAHNSVGKAQGLLIERHEDVGAGNAANDVVSRIREMLGDAAAAEAERQLGLKTTH